MEDLKAGLEKIDNRFGQFAKQLHDNFVTVAALKRLTAEELQEDFEIPKYAARSIAAAYLTSGESLLWPAGFSEIGKPCFLEPHSSANLSAK